MVVPGTSKVVLVGIVLDSTVVEDIQFAVGRNGSTVTLLIDNLTLIEVYPAVTAEIVHGSVQFTAFEVVETAHLMRIVGILMRQQVHVLADGLSTLVVQRWCTCSGVVVIVHVVFQGDILNVKSFTGILEQVGLVQSFNSHGRSRYDDGILGTLADQ